MFGDLKELGACFVGADSAFGRILELYLAWDKLQSAQVATVPVQ